MEVVDSIYWKAVGNTISGTICMSALAFGKEVSWDEMHQSHTLLSYHSNQSETSITH